MSEVKRYSLTLHKVKGKFESPEFERDNGEWVKFDDYARLKAERVHDLNQIGGLQQELARLRASSFVTAVPVEKYERVVAGGELVLREWSMGNEKGANNYLKALVIWNAAKEGKQS